MRPIVYVILACFIVGALIAGYVASTSTGARGPKEEGPGQAESQNAVAKVKVAPAARKEMEKTVGALGSVVAPPEDIQTLSVPFECQVRKIRVVAGEALTKGANIIDIEPSPDTALSLNDARLSKQAAERDLSQVQERVDMKLATKSELSTAQQTLQLAISKLQSLENRGIAPRQLIAESDEVVSKVSVQQGQIVPAGGTLVETVSSKRTAAKLGVNPAAAPQVKPGQTVHLQAAQGRSPIKADAEVRTVAGQVNPTSRLVDVYVALRANSGLMLETFVQAQIVVEHRMALAVPRSAVLPEEGKQILFTVEAGRAVRHEVRTGLEDEQDIELLGDAVKPGDMVVVEGNAELEDGMAVEARQAATVGSPASAAGSASAGSGP